MSSPETFWLDLTNVLLGVGVLYFVALFTATLIGEASDRLRKWRTQG